MYQRYPAVQPLPHPSLSYTNTDIGNIMPDSSENLPYNMSLQVLREFDRPIVYSLSPGTSVTPAMAKDVSGLVNLYRITADDWDNWIDVKRHFDVSRWLNYCIFFLQNILSMFQLCCFSIWDMLFHPSSYHVNLVHLILNQGFCNC
jgi:hypothetical protein